MQYVAKFVSVSKLRYNILSEWADVVSHQVSKLSAMLWWEQCYSWWDDDICFVLNEYTTLYFIVLAHQQQE